MSTAPRLPQRASEPRGFGRFWRVLKQLFYEFVGAAFAVLAVGWLNATLRAWNRDVARWLIAISLGIALLLIFFAVSSFRRARQL